MPSRMPRDFINEMAIAGMAEVEPGRGWRHNAPRIAFAEMMVTDHTQANAELTRIASQMKIQLPKQLDQKHRTHHSLFLYRTEPLLAGSARVRA